MKKDEFIEIEGAKVRCFYVAGNTCDYDEFVVDIVVCNRIYRIYTLVGPLEMEEAVCHRVYSEWKNGYHNNVIPEVI